MIQARNIDFTTFGIGNYSTIEQDTGFTWIDGKTIYKKTLNFGSLPISTNKTISHKITNLDKIIKIETLAINLSTGAAHMIDGVYGAASATAANNLLYENCFISSDGNVTISTNSDRSAFTAYVTLYYTARP